MNSIADEISSYLGSANLSDEEFLEHYGVKRRSGRYPWGSGEDPYQHGQDFLARVELLRKRGWQETPENIKKEFGLTVKQYRMEKSISTNERQLYRIATAKRLRDKGDTDGNRLNTSQIARKMGVSESTVRGWFEQDKQGKVYQSRETAEMLKKELKNQKYGMVDVGVNAEREIGISRERLDTAVYMLQREGYNVYSGRVPQPTNKNQMTTQKVLTNPNVEHKQIFDYDKVGTLHEYVSNDGGETYEKRFTYPKSMDSRRLKIRYAEDGGATMDGVLELRRNVPDLDLQGSKYSQVRILVDGTHYIKGMAVYSDNMPNGVDIVFNTNKTKDKSKMDVLKEIKDDRENPFGSAIKDVELGGQYWYTDKNGKKQLGLINKRADESDWNKWKDALPSQFLSKQSKEMAKKQLNLAKANKEAELDTIMSLENPTIKKYYLEKFASNCDSAAVDLKAAALPGQKYHVIIPVNTLKDNQIYAPGYEPGTKLALVRYPHGGTFEIPICTVVDKNAVGKKLIGPTSVDAVGINHKVAERLSGADFDGDTVMCIPTHDRRGKVKITSTRELESLKGFDNKLSYGTKEVTKSDGSKAYLNKYGKEIKVMSNTDIQMGEISNLITDMTLQGASTDKIARAVKHSMVVIDAEKHKLDYRQSFVDNNIKALQIEYQPKYNSKGELIGGGGANTLISKSKGQVNVDKRRGEAKINLKGKDWYDPSKPEGSQIYVRASDKDLYYADSKYDKKTGTTTIKTTDGKTITYNRNDAKEVDKYRPIMKTDPKTGEISYTNKKGDISYVTKKRTIQSTNMAETTDAHTLVSRKGHQMELIYADYANSMKSLANKARIELYNTPRLTYNPTAKEVYKKEVSSLNAKLNDALKNSVRERTATRKAASEINRRKEINPDLKGEDLRKLSQRIVSKYRNEVGAVSRKKRSININDREWEAIQSGAISDNKLKQILNNSDPDILKEKAMPKNKKGLTNAQINRIKAMSNSNFTLSQIAEKMNISTSQVSNILKGAK